MTIITTRWELTGVVNVTSMNDHFEQVKLYMDISKGYCESFGKDKLVGSQCNGIYESLTKFAKQVEEKKLMMSRSVGQEKRNKRQLMKSSPMVTKAAQILFGLCDANCVVNK